MHPVLQVKQLGKVYARGTVVVPALCSVDLEIRTGEFLAIMGPSGSGKSTLLHILGALEEPSAGEVHFQGTHIPDWGTEPRATDFRRCHLGFVFQAFNLVRSLTARENVGLPLLLDGTEPAEIQSQTQDWLERVGLWERRDHRPYELSGGEQQRIAIARALIHNPSMLLADEPTGNLDTANGRQILDLLEETCRERGTTTVLVTHDSVAASYADRVIYLRDGRIRDSWTLDRDHSRLTRIQATMGRLALLAGGEAS